MLAADDPALASQSAVADLNVSAAAADGSRDLDATERRAVIDGSSRASEEDDTDGMEREPGRAVAEEASEGCAAIIRAAGWPALSGASMRLSIGVLAVSA